MEKPIQRKEMIEQLKAMDLTEHQRKSDAIVRHLLEDPEFRKADTVGVTISAFPEVDTKQLIEFCWDAGKRTAVPRCNAQTREMTFRIITDFSQLETVYMKLREPAIELTEKVEPEEIDLLIVPGVVFSPDGYRIGFGGGYYDRYLTRFSGPTRSLAFDMQLAAAVPVEEHDLPVQLIYTETGSRDTGQVTT